MADGSPGSGGRKRGVQVDAVAVGIGHGRVPHAPERVEGLLDAAVPGLHQLGVLKWRRSAHQITRLTGAEFADRGAVTPPRTAAKQTGTPPQRGAFTPPVPPPTAIGPSPDALTGSGGNIAATSRDRWGSAPNASTIAALNAA